MLEWNVPSRCSSAPCGTRIGAPKRGNFRSAQPFRRISILEAMLDIRTLDDLLQDDLTGKAVLVRVDFNVPREGDRILDDTRIRAALPTLAALSSAGARTVLASHLGRPRGKADPSLSLGFLVPVLSELLEKPVIFSSACVGEVAEAHVGELVDGGFLLLENLRFHAEEEANDPDFARQLARLAPNYVNDAFGCSHRAHASIVGVTEHVAKAVGGRLLERELKAFGRLLDNAEQPFVAILGGAKIAGKIDAIDNLLPRVSCLLFGGGMANTLLAAKGVEMGASLVAHDELDVARRIFADAEKAGVDILLPTDLVVTDTLSGNERVVEITSAANVAEDRLAVDVGPETVRHFAEVVSTCRTVFWNGPLGVFEVPPFDNGCTELARALADSEAFSVVGGGETVAAIEAAGVADRIGHVSTGGGASLELVGGTALPGVTVLER